MGKDIDERVTLVGCGWICRARNIPFDMWNSITAFKEFFMRMMVSVGTLTFLRVSAPIPTEILLFLVCDMVLLEIYHGLWDFPGSLKLVIQIHM